ncbi:SDR family NAD(P)-dependent oxidoreductase [Rhodococcus sp. NPDC057014]|uniref:SDR family NAD(P)-dependent oxidoreductase n=1 Tax=Rhodococcus sp. NPDC057014 TaxID=3346000 RepID=UPI0036456AB9
MSRRLEGKVAVVTGSGRGIGRAYAHALAAEGAKIVVNDTGGEVDGTGHSQSPADAVAREITELGGEAVADYSNIADFRGAEQVMQTATANFGRLDILIANSGNIRMAMLDEATEADWGDVLGTHTNGTFNCIRHASPLMKQQGGGTIVTVGDITQGLHYPRLAAYRAAKAAILVLSNYAAAELQEFNINVNSVFPGSTSTRMAQAYFESLGDKTESFLADAAEYARVDSDGGSPAPPATVPPIGVYLCTDEGRSITGRSFIMDGVEIGLATTRSDLTFLAPPADTWTTGDLIAHIPDWLADADSQRTAARTSAACSTS